MPPGLTGPSAPQLPGLLMWALVSAVPALGSEAELPSVQGPGQASCARKNCSSGLLRSLAVTWLQAVCPECANSSTEMILGGGEPGPQGFGLEPHSVGSPALGDADPPS